MYNSKYIKTLKTTNTDQCQYSKCPQSHRSCGHVENAKAVEVEAEVVEVVHPTTNCHSAYAQNRSISSSSSALWAVAVGTTAPFPSCVTPTAPYTSYRSPQAAFVLIRSVYAPDCECPPHQH